MNFVFSFPIVVTDLPFVFKENIIAELEQTLDEAKETFQEKEADLSKLKLEIGNLTERKNELNSTNIALVEENHSQNEIIDKLKSELLALQSQVASKLEKKVKVAFAGMSPLNKLKGLVSSKTSSVSSLHSHGTEAHQVTSTFDTPYKAMHTKSSLLRLKAAHESPCKVDRCLDASCHANAEAAVSRTSRSKRKPKGVESDTRATKKRKSANKRRVSNVLKRVYETRSRSQKKH